MIISQNKIEKLQSVKVCTCSLSARGRGGGRGGEPPTKFSKRGGGLTGPQFLEGVAGKEGMTFFGREGGYNFSTKNKLKLGIFNNKKVSKQELFAMSSLRIQTGKF